MKNVPGIIYKLRCLGCMHSNQNKRSAVKKTSSETLKSIFLAEVAFLFSTKMKRSILLNITFLSASSNSTLVILLREKKTIYCLHGRWFLFLRKKSSCINYSVNTMTSCTRNLARAPYPQLSDGEYRGRIVRHRRLKTEPMLLRGLYNSSHHIFTSSLPPPG